MAWEKIAPADREILFKKMSSGLLTVEDAFNHNINFETLKRRLREYRMVRPEDGEMLFKSILSDAPKVEPIEHQLLLTADDIIITSDWHWPYTDPIMLLRVLAVGMRTGIRKLAIVGDTSNFDEYSKWPILVRDAAPSLTIQLKGLFSVIKRLAVWFTDGIFISSGNHDERMQISTNGNMSLGDLFGFASSNAKYSLHRTMWLKTRRALYALIHPQAYKAVSMSLAQEMVTKMVPPEPFQNQKFGAFVAHTHVGSIGFTKDGLHEAVGLPAMLDEQYIAYKKRGAANAVGWNKGFVVVKNSYIYMMYEKHTDWHMWLGDYHPVIEKLANERGS